VEIFPYKNFPGDPPLSIKTHRRPRCNPLPSSSQIRVARTLPPRGEEPPEFPEAFSPCALAEDAPDPLLTIAQARGKRRTRIDVVMRHKTPRVRTPVVPLSFELLRIEIHSSEHHPAPLR
jgi:hypothetical protein